MARTNIPHTEFSRAGVSPATPAPGDTVNQHVLTNDGRVILYVENADAVNEETVTVISAATHDGLAVADLVVTLPASESRFIGPFSEATFGRDISVDVSSVDVSLAAYHMRPA